MAEDIGKYNVIDLFCGCGGLSLGFQNAGFNVVAAFDNWDVALNLYAKNFSHPAVKRDLSDLNDMADFERYRPDIIIGGPPCQDFSIAGKLDLVGKRANLTRVFGRTVVSVRPEWFVMENVQTIERSPVFGEVLNALKDAGYGITKYVLDASYTGVPQKRKRYFVIGRIGMADDFMLEYLVGGLSDERMTVRKYFADSPLDTEFFYQHPRTYKRRAVFSVDEPSSTIRSVNRPIPSNYRSHPADRTADLSKVRPLTTAERAYIQTFPRSFRFAGKRSDIEQAIGNAVPVKMAEYVGKTILSFVKSCDSRVKPE